MIKYGGDLYNKWFTFLHIMQFLYFSCNNAIKIFFYSFIQGDDFHDELQAFLHMRKLWKHWVKNYYNSDHISDVNNALDTFSRRCNLRINVLLFKRCIYCTKSLMAWQENWNLLLSLMQSKTSNAPKIQLCIPSKFTFWQIYNYQMYLCK